MLVDPVIVAGDGARADVGLWPNSCVADVGQVIDLGASTDASLFDFDEIADLDDAVQLCAGTQTGIWANDATALDMTPL